MSLKYTSSYLIVIPTGNKKEKPEVGEMGEGNSSPFYPLPPFPPGSILIVINLSIGSEEDQLFLVLLIHINTHNRMEINS